MKRYECVKVKHHKNIGKTVDDWQKKGWCVHTYQAIETAGNPSNYLLFERDK